jgi:N-acetylglucosaminyldiphosphoundecaprenol N-acetyl-beta-D-mannosaminyltransferase
MHAMTIEDWVEVVQEAASTSRRRIMVGQNLHSVYLVHRDPDLAAAQRLADFVRIDGLPLVAFARMLGHAVTTRHRSGFMDLLDPLLARLDANGWTVYYLGSKPGVVERGLEVLRGRYPNARLEGAHGYFDPDDPAQNDTVIDRINAVRPHVLVVGMGMPRQERWILRNHDRLHAPAIVASGAAIDYVAGVVPTAPRWLSAVGLEWAFRLLAEPKRLWRRYLVEPWFVLALFVRDLSARWTGRRAA